MNWHKSSFSLVDALALLFAIQNSLLQLFLVLLPSNLKRRLGQMKEESIYLAMFSHVYAVGKRKHEWSNSVV